MQLVGEEQRSRRVRRLQPLGRGIVEPTSSLEDRLPRWILGSLALLLCVQVAIAIL